MGVFYTPEGNFYILLLLTAHWLELNHLGNKVRLFSGYVKSGIRDHLSSLCLPSASYVSTVILNFNVGLGKRDYKFQNFPIPSLFFPCKLETTSDYDVCLVAQSLTLCDPMSCCRTLLPWGFSKQEYWSRLPSPPPGNLLKLEIKPRFPQCRWFFTIWDTREGLWLWYESIHHGSERAW